MADESAELDYRKLLKRGSVSSNRVSFFIKKIFFHSDLKNSVIIKKEDFYEENFLFDRRRLLRF